MITKEEQLEFIYEEAQANLNLWIHHKDEKALDRYHELLDYASKLTSNS